MMGSEDDGGTKLWVSGTIQYAELHGVQDGVDGVEGGPVWVDGLGRDAMGHARGSQSCLVASASLGRGLDNSQ